MKVVMGIQIQDRDSEALKVQELLTKYGCIIKTRLGLHETNTNICSGSGLIILEFLNDSQEEINKLESELSKLVYVNVRKMVFE